VVFGEEQVCPNNLKVMGNLFYLRYSPIVARLLRWNSETWEAAQNCLPSYQSCALLFLNEHHKLRRRDKMTLQHLEQRFGATAVGKGYITLDLLMEALQIQVRENIEGKTHRLTGRILCDLGYMTFQQVEEVLFHMRSFRRYLDESNDSSADEDMELNPCQIAF
jgi:hypothetical protein